MLLGVVQKGLTNSFLSNIIELKNWIQNPKNEDIRKIIDEVYHEKKHAIWMIYVLKIVLIQTYKFVKTLGHELSCNKSNDLPQMIQ